MTNAAILAWMVQTTFTVKLNSRVRPTQLHFSAYTIPTSPSAASSTTLLSPFGYPYCYSAYAKTLRAIPSQWVCRAFQSGSHSGVYGKTGYFRANKSKGDLRPCSPFFSVEFYLALGSDTTPSTHACVCFWLAFYHDADDSNHVVE